MSVVVPTFRRVARLDLCLDGLSKQERRADEVLVIVHVSDEESAVAVARIGRDWPELRCAQVQGPGLVAALNCGLAAATGAIVAYVDDDAIPQPDWLERIARTFATDKRIAAVGGRDMIVIDGHPLDAARTGALARHRAGPDVGRLQWCGRMLGNHHLGAGGPRDVDVLKGVNMSFRRESVPHGFDERLRGRGAQVHSELSICLPLRRRGLRVVYDPQIIVQHHPAPRPHGDRRADRVAEDVAAAAHNEALQLHDHFSPARRIVFAAWALVIGTTDAPGLGVLARDMLNGTPAAVSRFRAAQAGRAAAWRTCRTRRRVPATPFTEQAT